MSYIETRDVKDLVSIKSKKDFSDTKWNIIDLYMEQYQKKQILALQFESFHYFMEKLIPDKIYSYNPLVIRQVVPNAEKTDKKVREVNCEIYFENHSYEDPTFIESNGRIKRMYPHDARQRDLTYSVALVADLRIECEFYEDGVLISRITDKVIPKCSLGKIPIYVRSKYCLLEKYKDTEQLKNECKFDKGGYTIINGNEKVIIAQEKMCDNKINVFKAKRNSKYEYTSVIRSMNPETKVSYKIAVMGSLRDQIVIKISHIKKEIPLFIFLRAMGIESDKKIIRTILLDEHKNVNYLELLEPSVDSTQKYKTMEDALEYISKLFTIQMAREDKLEYVKSFLQKNILPHVGNDLKNKHIMMGYLVKALLDVLLEKKAKSDRDHYSNKRVDQPGNLQGRLFHYLFQKLIKDLKDSVIKDINTSGLDFKPDNIIIKASIIENGFKYALATGDWNVKIGNNYSKLMGVAQMLNRLNNVATLSHLRRINTPIDKTVKLIKPRRLHGSHFGKICPAETPEGASVGVVKNATISCCISIEIPEEPIYQFLIDFETILVDEIEIEDITDQHVKVFMNGRLIGFHQKPYYLVELLIEQRRKGAIAYSVSVRYNINSKEVNIHSDCGRPFRPLFIVKNNKLNMTINDVENLAKGRIGWNDLLLSGCIEYLDTEEEESALIAMNINVLNRGMHNYTHCEIDESFTLLGVCGSLIPFPEHNQSPRNSYQSAMCKQALGLYASNYAVRFDTVSYVLSYPQVPLVSTRMYEYLNYNDLPNGQNIIVAFAAWSGYNQEDSVILNQSAIERGLFECFTYKTYKNEEMRKSTTMIEEKFCDPKEFDVSGTKHGDYSKLNKYGFVDLETKVEGDDIIIGKVTPIINYKDKSQVIYKDSSTELKSNEPGYIDKVLITRNSDGYKIYKTKVRHLCTPGIGDKFASTSAQKGTVGMVFKQEDMPRTEDGIIPDLIINPHAIPSRMTIAQKIGTLLGIYISETGDTKMGDATAFQELQIDEITKGLHDNGFNSVGNKTMISGQTGEEMKCQMFIGPTYYQRLKHMVADKIHSRAKGPVQLLTRQPVEGRSRDGGLRLGEMERDVFLAQGVSHFLRERLYDCSDPYSIFVCDYCHRMAIVCPQPNQFTKEPIYRCYKCTNFTNFTKVDLPYSSKLFFQELECMGIGSEFHTE